ncbi:MAG: peptide chain release factor N(5)-glutamine methyltransferase, partial [Burkholderiales bacterium]
HLNQGDLRFEPRRALLGGADGLESIRRIVAGAPRRLAPGGWLLLEHGYDQAGACRMLLEQAGFSELAGEKDLAGHPRVCAGRLTAG